MKILIFSDSHGQAYGMRRALRLHPDAEAVFFLGDGLFDMQSVRTDTSACWYFVRGNCDIGYRLMDISCELVDSVTLCGRRILFTHGDAFGVKFSTAQLLSEARAREADIVLFGHTHVPTEQYIVNGERPIWLFNPGTVGGRGGKATYGLLTLTERDVLFSHGTVE
jgi:putative phosphoesterase